MSDDWNEHWKSNSTLNRLNPAQVYRQKLVFDALQLTPTSRLLDLGSGTGELLLTATRRQPGLEVLGLDLSEEGCRLAQQKLPAGRFFACDFSRELPVPQELDGWATHAVCSEVLEHLDDPAGALRRVRRLLAPGARLVITVPGGPMSAFDKHIGHRNHFTRERLTSVLTAGGFVPERVDGAGAPFFNLYRLTVVARGQQLIADTQREDRAFPLAGRVAMRAFNELFRFNRDSGRFGWQLVAVAQPAGVEAKA